MTYVCKKNIDNVLQEGRLFTSRQTHFAYLKLIARNTAKPTVVSFSDKTIFRRVA